MLNYKDIMSTKVFKNSMSEANKNRYSGNKVEIPIRVRLKTNTPYPAIINDVTYDKKKKQTNIKFLVFNEEGKTKEFNQMYSDNDYAQEVLEDILDMLLNDDEWDSLANLIGKMCIVKLVKKDQFTNIKVISRCFDEEDINDEENYEEDYDIEDNFDEEEEDE